MVLPKLPARLNQMLGGKIRYCCAVARTLNHLFDFQSQEVHLLQGYGLTETSPVISMSTPSNCVGERRAKPFPMSVAISERENYLSRTSHHAWLLAERRSNVG